MRIREAAPPGGLLRFEPALELRRIRSIVSSTVVILAKAVPKVASVVFLISSTVNPPVGKVSVPSLGKNK
jgi:hypothetical protein